MNYCPHCGKPIDYGHKFCPECGMSSSDWQHGYKGTNTDDYVRNTSGQGKNAVIPSEIKGWNWGAFFLGWIWGIGNSVWLALISIIPYVGFVMSIVLGVKGNEWAWKSKRWNSVEHFKNTQKTWAWVGLVIVVFAFLVLPILAAIIVPNVSKFIDDGGTEANDTELSNVRLAVTAMMADARTDSVTNPDTSADNDLTDVYTVIDGTTYHISDYLQDAGNMKCEYTIESDGWVTQFDCD